MKQRSSTYYYAVIDMLEDIRPLVRRPRRHRGLRVVLLHVLLVVARVLVVLQHRHDRRRYLLANQRLPVQSPEPRVPLELQQTRAPAPQPLTGRLHQQRLDERVARHSRAPRGLIPEVADVIVNLLIRGVLVGERGQTGDHLVHEDAERPQVHRAIVPASTDNLRRDVIWRSAHRVRLLLGNLLGEAVVHNLDVPVPVEQQVLGLEVAVHDALRVHVLQREHHARGVEPAPVLGKLTPGLGVEVAEELAPERRLEEHVNLELVPVRLDEPGAERVGYLAHQQALVPDVRLLPILGDARLGHALQRESLARLPVLHQPDPAERPHAKRGQQHQITDVDPLRRLELLQPLVVPVEVVPKRPHVPLERRALDREQVARRRRRARAIRLARIQL
mmetsp:Transcript_14324/g.58328  ORF Transcript_14324/g.58328 Transcript_14324/m.58328 type:complete len:390 (+) Transcript_14324:2365-3534(+)